MLILALTAFITMVITTVAIVLISELIHTNNASYLYQKTLDERKN